MKLDYFATCLALKIAINSVKLKAEIKIKEFTGIFVTFLTIFICCAEMFSDVHGPIHGQLEPGVSNLLSKASERKEQNVVCTRASHTLLLDSMYHVLFNIVS